MAKPNEQYEEILDELSILKSKNIANEQRLANIESLLIKLSQKESPPPTTPKVKSPEDTLSYSTLKDAVYDGIACYYSDMPDSTGVLSDKNIKNMGETFIHYYKDELKKQYDKYKEQLDLVFWLREMTFCTYCDAIRTILPAGMQLQIVQKTILTEPVPDVPLSEAEAAYYHAIEEV